MTELHFFNRSEDYSIFERKLPHWMQAGVLCFITFRTNDSMPSDVLHRWRDHRDSWLRTHHINPQANDWRQRLGELGQGLQNEFHRTYSNKWHEELDSGHGACVLSNVELATIVGDSLGYADGDQYDLTDFVVMPNHVHLIAAFRSDLAEAMRVVETMDCDVNQSSRESKGTLLATGRL